LPDPFNIIDVGTHMEVRLTSADETNRLTRACVLALTDALLSLSENAKPLIVAGNSRFFSAGADLREIQSLDAVEALAFARTGQRLMNVIDCFPRPVFAAVEGYCMGGGLDLALACHCRVASPNAIFGHRGAALGLMTGWGGTQRLPHLIGKSRTLALLAKAEKIHAQEALTIGLVDAIADDPTAEALRRLREREFASRPFPSASS
jgi:enoyl-CoA hydratase/carnithine racemase